MPNKLIGQERKLINSRPKFIIRKYRVITTIADYKKMGEEIYRMYSDSELYNKYKEKSKESFMDFSPEKIMKEFQEKVL